jgi:hypothetical protein
MATYNIDLDFNYVTEGRRERALAALAGAGSHTVAFSVPIALVGQRLPPTRGWIIEGIEIEADAASDLVISWVKFLPGADDPTTIGWSKTAGTAFSGPPVLSGYALADGELLNFVQTVGNAKIKVRMRVDA